ncbi:MAG: ArsC/Spx/MgsR family protein [Gammaproteobacteria bacterium]
MDKTFIYYHNPRCSKSREGLSILEKSIENFKIKLYLTENITFNELKQIVNKLNIKPIDLVRKKEKVIKDNKINLDCMLDKEILETLIAYPILIERPILISEDKAIIGRPPELIKSIL